jgi:hypothetical protein
VGAVAKLAWLSGCGRHGNRAQEMLAASGVIGRGVRGHRGQATTCLG